MPVILGEGHQPDQGAMIAAVTGKDRMAGVLPLPRILAWIVENPARAAVVVSVILLLYQACLPEGLTLDPAARDIEWRVIPSAGFDVPRSDVVGNLIPYGVFAHLLFVASWRRDRRLARASLVSFFGTLGIALAVEGVEYFNLNRQSATWDLISAGIGATLALLTGAVYTHLFADRFSVYCRAELRHRPVTLAATMLALSLLFDAARPFHVISNAGYLFDNIQRSTLIPFEPPGRDLREQLGLRSGPWRVAEDPSPRTADYWAGQAERFLMYATLLGLLAFRRRGEFLRKVLLPWAGVLILIEWIALGIVGGRGDITHFVVGLMGAPLAVAAARYFERHSLPGALFLLAVFISYVFISDLRPFELGPRQPFSLDQFIPLIHHYRNPDVMVLSNILEAALVYAPVGMLIYLIRLHHLDPLVLQGRWPSLAVAWLPCAALASLMELAQLWIPARTPGVEDILYAVIGGCAGASAARLYFYHTHPGYNKDGLSRGAL